MITMETLAASNRDYIAKMNNNFTALAAAVNALQSAIGGALGPGAALITDVMDRPGLVGTHAYSWDLENYDGGTGIDIGRRPAPVLAYGETDVSTAWVNIGSSF